MFQTVLTIVGLAGLSNALTWARPFREALNLVGLDDMSPLESKFIENDGFFGPRPNPTNTFTYMMGSSILLFRELFACAPCMSFWIALAYTQDFLMAGSTMVATRLIDAN